jgi:hypothetical protein
MAYPETPQPHLSKLKQSDMDSTLPFQADMVTVVSGTGGHTEAF